MIPDESKCSIHLIAQYCVLIYLACSTISSCYQVLKGYNFQRDSEFTLYQKVFSSLIQTKNGETLIVLKQTNDIPAIFTILAHDENFEKQIGDLKELLQIELYLDQQLDDQSDTKTVENFLNSQKENEMAEHIFQYKKLTAFNQQSLIIKAQNNSQRTLRTHGQMVIKKLNSIWKITIKEFEPQSEQSQQQVPRNHFSDFEQFEQSQQESLSIPQNQTALLQQEVHLGPDSQQELDLQVTQTAFISENSQAPQALIQNYTESLEVQTNLLKDLQEPKSKKITFGLSQFEKLSNQSSGKDVVINATCKEDRTRFVDPNYFSLMNLLPSSSGSKDSQFQNQNLAKKFLMITDQQPKQFGSDSSDEESIVSNFSKDDNLDKYKQNFRSNSSKQFSKVQFDSKNQFGQDLFKSTYKSQSLKQLKTTSKNVRSHSAEILTRNDNFFSNSNLQCPVQQDDDSDLDRQILENFAIRIEKILKVQDFGQQHLKRAIKINEQVQHYLKNKRKMEYKQNVELRNKLQDNKIFLYMIIHDLKHPAESLNNQLQLVLTQINQGKEQLMKLTENAREIDDQWVQYEKISKKASLIEEESKEQSEQIQVSDSESENYQNNSEKSVSDDEEQIDLNQFTEDENIFIDLKTKHKHLSHLMLVGYKQMVQLQPYFQQIEYFLESEVVEQNDSKQKINNFNSNPIPEGLQKLEQSMSNASQDFEQPNLEQQNLQIQIQSIIATKRSHSNPIKSQGSPQSLKHQVATQIGQLTLTPQEIDNLLTEQIKFLLTVRKENTRFQQLLAQVIQMKSVASMMINLLQDLLDLAQMENNSFSLHNSYCSIIDTVEKAFDIVRPGADLKNVQLVFEKPTCRNERMCYREILLDQRRLTQILVNFISNGIKFSNQGGQVRVSIIFHQVQVSRKASSNIVDGGNVSHNENNLYSRILRDSNQGSEEFKSDLTEMCFVSFDIVIQDTGMGIPKDKIDSLFVNFSKIDNHKHNNPHGIGLGLSICKNIVEQMGGQVKVESEEGKGTKFFISMKSVSKIRNHQSNSFSKKSLEAQKRQISSQGQIEQVANRTYKKLLISSLSYHKYQSMMKSNQSSSPNSLNSQQISNHDKIIKQANLITESTRFLSRCLVANDDPIQLEFISAILGQYFTEVDQTENGFAAFKFVQEHRRSNYDLIVLDLNMPIMGGIEASQKITEYFNQSSLTEMVKFGQQISLKENILEHFNIDYLPAIVALTADVNPDVSKGKFKKVINGLDKPTVEQLLQLAQLSAKEQAWKHFLNDYRGVDSNLGTPQSSVVAQGESSKNLYSSIIDINQNPSEESKDAKIKKSLVPELEMHLRDSLRVSDSNSMYNNSIDQSSDKNQPIKIIQDVPKQDSKKQLFFPPLNEEIKEESSYNHSSSSSQNSKQAFRQRLGNPNIKIEVKNQNEEKSTQKILQDNKNQKYSRFKASIKNKILSTIKETDNGRNQEESQGSNLQQSMGSCE